jgi:ABC-type amino acid transport substrate-binding protein
MVRCMERFMHRCRVSIIVFACAMVAGVFAPVARAQQASQAPVAAPAAAATDVAPTAPRIVRVGVYEVPPFAEPDAALKWKGFAVVLFEASAIQLQMIPEFRQYANIDDLMSAVEKGEVEAGIGNIMVTSKRLTQVDFSQPILDGGLRVMVPSDRTHTLRRLWNGLVEDGHVQVLFWALVGMLVLSVVVMGALRRLDQEFSKHWHEGFAEAMYHVVSVMMTGKTSYKGKLGPAWLGRVIASVWLVFGVASVAYVTSSITSVMTADTISDAVHGPKDLPGRTVGVITGSVGARYCAEHGIDVVTYDTLDEAARALADRVTDAVVSDAQSLEFYDVSHPQVNVAVVGEMFERRHYAFPINRAAEDLRRRIDVVLVGLREDGMLEQLRRRSFGH